MVRTILETVVIGLKQVELGYGKYVSFWIRRC